MTGPMTANAKANPVMITTAPTLATMCVSQPPAASRRLCIWSLRAATYASPRIKAVTTVTITATCTCERSHSTTHAMDAN